MLNPLYQKHHGMPGIGVKGHKGETGEKGNGIYIGFINDFFETNDISVNAFVKIAQRKVSSYEKETFYNDYAASRYQKFQEAVNENPSQYSYISQHESVFENEAESLYYTGRLSDDKIADRGSELKYDVMDNKIESERYFATDGLISETQMPERWEFHQIYNIIKDDKSYVQLYEYNKDEQGFYTTEPKYDVRISVDTMTYEPQDIVRLFGGYESYNQPLYEDIVNSSIWFNYIRYNPTATNTRSTIWYTTQTYSADTSAMFERIAFNLDMDYMFENNPDIDSGNAVDMLGPEYERGNDDSSHLKSSNYALGVDSHFTVVNARDIPVPGNITYNYNADLRNLPYITTASRAKVNKKVYIKYDGQPIKDYLLPQYVHITANTVPPAGLEDAFVDDNHMTQIALDIYDPSIYSTIVYNSSNNLEFDRPALYNILNDEKHKQQYLKNFANNYRNLAEDFLQKYEITINHYKNNGATIPDSSVRWSSSNYEKLSIPTTLSHNYKVGDVIYFYVDERQFNEDGKITYMVTITEDLLDCDINTLMKNAKIVDPFEYQTLFTDNGRVTIFDNVNILKNNSEYYFNEDTRDVENYYMRSIGNIISDGDESILLVGSKPAHEKYDYIDLEVVKGRNNYSMQFSSHVEEYKTSAAENAKLMQYKIATNNAILKLNNLYIKKDSYLTNLEAYDIIYDPHIIYMSDYCLQSLSTEDVIVKVNFGDLFEKEVLNTFNTYAFVINKDRYIAESQYFGDYQLGYTVFSGNEIIFDELLDSNIHQDVLEIDPIKDTGILDKQDVEYPYTEEIEYRILVYIHKNTGQNVYAKCTTLRCAIQLQDRYKLTQPEYTILIDGESAALMEEYTDLIKFTLSGISVSESDVILDISTDNEDVFIDSVYFNNEELIVNSSTWSWAVEQADEVKQRLSRNLSWLSMTPDPSTILFERSHKVFDISVKDNIPDIAYVDTNAKVRTSNIAEFMVTFDDAATTKISDESDYRSMFFDSVTEGNVQCELFNRIMHNMPISMATSRYVNIAVKYHLTSDPLTTENNSYPSYYENYIVTQPGFTDPRNIPTVDLKLYNQMSELEQFNRVEQGILCNQVQSFMTVQINGFGYDTWGKYIQSLDDTTIELEITNIPNDLDWVKELSISQKITRSTIKVLPDDQEILAEDSDLSFNNCVKLSVRAFTLPDDKTIYNITQADIDEYTEAFKDKCEITIDHQLMRSNIGEVVPEECIHEGYILLTEEICQAFINPENVYAGIFESIKIHLKNLNIEDVKKQIIVNFIFEMGNPMVANFYLQFAVTKLTIHYFDNGVDHTFSTFADDNNINDTYLHQIEDNNETYTFISERFDMMVNPLSYIACPQEKDEELPYVYGSVKKYGPEDQIQLGLKFYSSNLYNSEIMTINKAEQRKNMAINWSGLLLKKKHLQDNTKYISLKTMTLNDTIGTFSKDYIYKYADYESVLTTAKSYEPINNMNYLAVTYHSNILNPKLRDDERSFIYNEKAYLESKYDQYNKRCPVFVQAEHNWAVRTDEIMEAIDTWNFEFQSMDKIPNDEGIFTGVINTYGNGYNYLPDSIDTGLYDRNGIIRLEELKEYNKETLFDKADYADIGAPTPITINTPASKKMFRAPLYHIAWEYQVYNGTNIIPYRIMSVYDYVMIDRFNKNPSPDNMEDMESRGLYSYTNANRIPYNMLYRLRPRIAYNDDTNTLNCFMLRRPAIGDDNDIKETCIQNCYKLNNRLYNLTDGINNMPNTYQIP